MSAYWNFLGEFYGPDTQIAYHEAVQRAGQMLAAALADLAHDGRLLTERAA